MQQEENVLGINGVPCRHLMDSISAGDLWGISDVKKIVPVVMPANGVHDAFSTGGRAWFFHLR